MQFLHSANCQKQIDTELFSKTSIKETIKSFPQTNLKCIISKLRVIFKNISRLYQKDKKRVTVPSMGKKKWALMIDTLLIMLGFNVSIKSSRYLLWLIDNKNLLDRISLHKSREDCEFDSPVSESLEENTILKLSP